MSDDELARWRALADAATPGPWLPAGSTHPLCLGGVYEREGEVVERILTDRPDADAAFIATAREAMPRLLAEVARLRALTRAVSIDRDTIEVERDEARREVERLRSQLESARDLHTRMMRAIHEAAGVRPDGLAAILAWVEGARDAMSRDELAELRRFAAALGEPHPTSATGDE